MLSASKMCQMRLLTARKSPHFQMLKHWVCLKYQTTAVQTWNAEERPFSLCTAFTDHSPYHSATHGLFLAIRVL